MLSNRIAAALFGAGALLFTGLAVAPASAAPIAAGNAPAASAEAGLVQQAWHYGRPHYRRRRVRQCSCGRYRPCTPQRSSRA